MNKAINKFWTQHTALAIGAIASIILLVAFLLFQNYTPGVISPLYDTIYLKS